MVSHQLHAELSLSRPWYRHLLAVAAAPALAIALLLSPSAHPPALAQAGSLTQPVPKADELSEVRQLMADKRFDQALGKLDALIAAKPRDAQLRFTRGVVLSEAGRAAEAITTFEGLTQDFPELPEPYNNLAVLYAAQGQYDKARSALDLAIRNRPDYSTAHENLGDVYAKMAAMSYERALKAAPQNAAIKAKYDRARDMFMTVRPVPAAGLDGRENRATAPNPVTPSAPAQPATPAASPAPSKGPMVAGASSQSETEADVITALQGWARAWSDRDADRHLAYYAPNFNPPTGKSRKAFLSERRDLISGKKSIEVRIESPEVQIEGDRATVRFRQLYAADKTSSALRKTLILEKIKGRWLIQQEQKGV